MKIGIVHFQANKRDVTFLISCLTTLLVTINENKNIRKQFDVRIKKDFIAILPNELGLLESTKPNINDRLIGMNDFVVPILSKYELIAFKEIDLIQLIRNGLAHQNIEAINKDGSWIGVKIWNMRGKLKTMEIEFSVEQLKTLILYLSDRILKSKKNRITI